MAAHTQKTAYVGETQRFECQVVAFPAPNITWFKDNINITNNPRYNIGFNAENGTITLMLHHVTPADEGFYVCRAENSEGHAITSAHLVVKVGERRKGIGHKYSAMSTERLSEEEMSQVEVIKQGRQTIIEEVITRIEESEKEVIEEKHIAPKIDYDLDQEHMELKMNASLYIEVDYVGTPKPKILWYHGERQVEEDARLTVEDDQGWCYLKKKNVQVQDSGVYRVTAENVAGLDQAEFNVLVQGVPTPPRNVRVIEVNKDYVILMWDEPEHNGGDEITEYLIEKSLAGGMFINCGRSPYGTTKFKVTKLFEGNVYWFRVVAVNRVGESEPASTAQAVKAKLPFDPPGPPEDVSVKSYDCDHVVVTWLPPVQDGGSPITQYIIDKKDVSRTTGVWVFAGTVDARETSYKVTKLFQGSAYNVRVFAENRVGPGEPCELPVPVIAQLPYDKPAPPRNLRAAETGSDFIELRWDPPEGDSSTPLTGYIIEKRDAKRAEYFYLTDLPPTVTSYRATRLFAGSEYYFRVMAENPVGNSDPCTLASPVVAKPPFDEPSAPRNLRVKSFWSDQVVLEWDCPESDGGKPITGYIVEKRDAQRSNWVKSGTTDKDIRTFTAKNLFEGAEYYFRVFAENSMGASRQAAELPNAQKARMPFDLPSAPTDIQVTDCSTDHMTVTWRAPAQNGGSDVLRYIVEKRDNIITMWSQAGVVDGQTHSLYVDKLFEGQSYFFRVSTETQAGRGPGIETSKPAVAKLPYGRPGMPRNVRVTDVWRDYMTITWDAPDKDGRSPITGYNIEQRDAFEGSFKYLCTVDASRTSHQVTNLQEGHEYYFRVYAQNAAGLSDKPGEIKPAVRARVPFDPPKAPQDFCVTDTSPGRIAVSWRAPEAGDLISYVIQARDVMGSSYKPMGRVDADTTSYKLTGLDQNTDYYVRVYAENAAGLSKMAAENERPIPARTPIKPPSSPSSLRPRGVNRTSVTLVWEAPADTGGSDVTGYVIEARKCSADRAMAEDYRLVGFAEAHEHEYKALALREGEFYDFRVRAQNKAADGEWCELAKPVQAKRPFDQPSCPRDLLLTSHTPSTLGLSWGAPDNDGGAPITGYTLSIKGPLDADFKFAKVLDTDQTSFTLSRLEPETAYQVRVCAENEAGESMPLISSELFKTAPKIKLPSAPCALSTSDVTSDHVTLTWRAPADDGGAPILHYIVKQKSKEDAKFSKVMEVEASRNSCVLYDLLPDTAYEFSVEGCNEVGVGEPVLLSTPFKTEKAISPPSAPRDIEVSRVEAESVSLSWKEPEHIGGAPISKYMVAKRRADDPDFVPVFEVPGEVLQCIVGNLDPETDYLFMINARNVAGAAKEPAATQEPVTTPKKINPPSAPGKLGVSSVNPDNVTLTWEAPQTDGGAPVSKYIVAKRRPSEPEFTRVCEVAGDELSYVVSGLEEQSEYEFCVHAVNEAGQSPSPATIGAPVKTPKKIIPPGSPRKLHVSNVESDKACLSWKAPKKYGGSAIVKYSVYTKKTSENEFTLSCELPAESLSCDVLDLDENEEYEIRIYSENEAGQCETPLVTEKPIKTRSKIKPPTSPRQLSVSDVTSESVSLSWKPAKDSDGSPPTKYIIFKKAKQASDYIQVAEINATVFEYSLQGLQEKTSYSFRIVASNEAGPSASGVEIKEPVQTLAKATPPDAPHKLKISDITPESVSLSWKAPKNDGGSPITNYIIALKADDEEEYTTVQEVSGDVHKCVVSGLKEQTGYAFSVHAKTEVGVSAVPLTTESPVKTAVKPKPSSVPRDLVVDHVTSDSVTLTWKAPHKDGGTPITKYRVTRQAVGVDKEFSHAVEVSSDCLQCVLNELSDNTAYSFAVVACNEAGESEPLCPKVPVLTKPAIVTPTAPASVSVNSVGLNSVDLSWEAVPPSAGAGTLRYVVEMQQVGAETWQQVVVNDGPVTKATVSGLSNQETYRFRVCTENETGRSEFSELQSEVALQKPKPACPKTLKAENIGVDCVDLSWSIPDESSRAPVLRYVVEAQEEGGAWQQVLVTDSPVTMGTVANLTNEKPYHFRICAENEAGKSEFALMDAEIVLQKPAPTKTAPGVPGSLELTSAEDVTLSWQPPEQDGGSPVTQYIVVYREESKKKFKKCVKTSADVTSVSIKDKLETGLSYYVRVYAENEQGVSEEAAELSVPVSLPSPPPAPVEETPAPEQPAVTEKEPEEKPAPVVEEVSVAEEETPALEQPAVTEKEPEEKPAPVVEEVSVAEEAAPVAQDKNSDDIAPKKSANTDEAIERKQSDEITVKEHLLENGESEQSEIKHKQQDKIKDSRDNDIDNIESLNEIHTEATEDNRGAVNEDLRSHEESISAEEVITQQKVETVEMNALKQDVIDACNATSHDIDGKIPTPVSKDASWENDLADAQKTQEIEKAKTDIDDEGVSSSKESVLKETGEDSKELIGSKHKDGAEEIEQSEIIDSSTDKQTGILGDTSDSVKDNETVSVAPTREDNFPCSEKADTVKDNKDVKSSSTEDVASPIEAIENEKQDKERDLEGEPKEQRANENLQTMEEQTAPQQLAEKKPVAPVLPSAPRDFTFVEISKEGISLKWREPDTGNTTGYVVVMRSADKKKYKKVAKTELASCTVSEKLKEAMQYFFRVYAQSEAGISEEYAELREPVTYTTAKDEVDAPVKPKKEKKEKKKEEKKEVKVEEVLVETSVCDEKVEPEATVPTFTQLPQDVSVQEGGVITISCKVSGIPIPDLSWYKDGKKIRVKHDPRMSLTADFSTGAHTLCIRDAREADLGKYTVKMRNICGEQKITITAFDTGEINVQDVDSITELKELAADKMASSEVEQSTNFQVGKCTKDEAHEPAEELLGVKAGYASQTIEHAVPSGDKSEMIKSGMESSTKIIHASGLLEDSAITLGEDKHACKDSDAINKQKPNDDVNMSNQTLNATEDSDGSITKCQMPEDVTKILPESFKDTEDDNASESKYEMSKDDSKILPESLKDTEDANASESKYEMFKDTSKGSLDSLQRKGEDVTKISPESCKTTEEIDSSEPKYQVSKDHTALPSESLKDKDALTSETYQMPNDKDEKTTAKRATDSVDVDGQKGDRRPQNTDEPEQDQDEARYIRSENRLEDTYNITDQQLHPKHATNTLSMAEDTTTEQRDDTSLVSKECMDGETEEASHILVMAESTTTKRGDVSQASYASVEGDTVSMLSSDKDTVMPSEALGVKDTSCAPDTASESLIEANVSKGYEDATVGSPTDKHSQRKPDISESKYSIDETDSALKYTRQVPDELLTDIIIRESEEPSTLAHGTDDKSTVAATKEGKHKLPDKNEAKTADECNRLAQKGPQADMKTEVPERTEITRGEDSQLVEMEKGEADDVPNVITETIQPSELGQDAQETSDQTRGPTISPESKAIHDKTTKKPVSDSAPYMESDALPLANAPTETVKTVCQDTNINKVDSVKHKHHPTKIQPVQSSEELATDKVDGADSDAEEKPILEITCAPSHIKAGERLIICASVKATPDATVSFAVNGKKIKPKKKEKGARVDWDMGTDTYSLIIEECSLQDAGVYTVTAENTKGTVNQDVTVAVSEKVKKEKPKVDKISKSLSGKEGQDLTFTVPVQGSPVPEITVTKDGEPVDKANIKVNEGQVEVTIPHLIAQDSGAYSLHAKNDVGATSRDFKVKVLPKDIAPSIAEQMECEINVKDGELLKLVVKATGTPTPTADWFHDGKAVTASADISTTADDGVYSLVVKKARVEDSGEYRVRLSNSAGTVESTANVTVTDRDREILQKLASQIEAERQLLPDTDIGMLFKQYPMLDDYTDQEKGVTLAKDDIVEVMDTENPAKWLVRDAQAKDKVCYVPTEYLLGAAQDDSDIEELPDKGYPVYEALADYTPSDESGLAIKEGERVSVLDDTNADRWLCRLPNGKQGFVPPGYLVAHRGERKADTRRTQEQFREDVLKIQDKDKEAAIRRRYAVKDLWESEQQYIKDVKYMLDNYCARVREAKGLTAEVRGGDVLFTGLPDIQDFHHTVFLPRLIESGTEPDSVARAFLDHRDAFFAHYLPYFADRPQADSLLRMPNFAKFLQGLGISVGNVSEKSWGLHQYLRRPSLRIDEYVTILQDLVKYSLQAGDDASRLEEAIEMLLGLKRRAQDSALATRIDGYPGRVADLGDIRRHDDFVVWEGEAAGKGKERHLILFEDVMLITKRINPIRAGDLPRYEYRDSIELHSKYELNEQCSDGRRFEIWRSADKQTTFQARSEPIKLLWCEILRQYLAPYNPGTAPEITTTLEDIEVLEGEKARFTCKVTGDPRPDVEWTCNGKTLKDGKKYKIIYEEETVTLVINKVNADMTGTYRVFVRNKRGSADKAARLSVQEREAPKFLSKLRDYEVLFGEDATFRFSVTGVPRPKITWFRNGTELTADPRLEMSCRDDVYTLVVRGVCEVDDGTYSVKAENDVGCELSQAKLFITDLEEKRKECPPDFVSGLKDVLASENMESKLSCHVKGYPTPDVTWYFNGERLHSDSTHGLLFDGAVATCTMAYTHEENAGTYTCRIKNKFGELECSAELSVALKPKVLSRFTDQELFRGEKAELVCTIAARPAPEVAWYHDKNHLTESERLKLYRDGDTYKLLLNNVILSDSGEYTCVVRNQAGQAECVAKLFVTEDTVKGKDEAIDFAPSFTKKMSNVEAIEGQSAKFTVKFIGEPTPTIKWLRKGREVALDSRVKVERDGAMCCLVFDTVTMADAGYYACYLSNSAGEDKCSAELLVEELVEKAVKSKPVGASPMMSLDKPSLLELDEDYVQLTWTAATLPLNAAPTDIRYIIERKDLGEKTDEWDLVRKDIDGTTFKYKEFDVHRDYLYRVRASNEYGISEPSMVASYYGRPMVTRRSSIQEDRKEMRRPSLAEIAKERRPPRAPRDKPVISDVTADSLKLTWQPGSIPEFAEETDIYYIIERRCPPSKNWIDVATDVKELSYTLQGYKCEKDYMFRIRASNEYGISEPSMSATLFAKPADAGFSERRSSVADITKAKVKPRTVWEKPDVCDVSEKSCRLRWKPSSMPDYAAQIPIWYVVEQRIPPNLEWTRVDSECKETECKITVNRSKDYYWRIRAANEVGVAEPSMPAMLRRVEGCSLRELNPNTVCGCFPENRTKAIPDVDPQRRRRSWSREMTPGSRGVPIQMRVPAEFVSRPDEKQYGVETRTSHICTTIRGYPEPKITWYFKGEPLRLDTDKFKSAVTSSGELSLEIADFSWSDVGCYHIKIENEFGSATQEVQVEMADPPTFLEPLKDQVFHMRQNGKLECRVHGIPYPTVQFKHDWRVVADSHRIKVLREDEDHWTLTLNNTIQLDEGMYECVAENVAGKVYCTATVKVTEKPGLFRDIKFNPVPVEDYFHVIDELGRGSYGIVRRVIDKNSGTQYAAKFLRFADVTAKEELEMELATMGELDHTNIIQVTDGYEDKKRLVIVMEIVTGGELLQRLLREDALTESESAFYIRQLLLAVHYMHTKNVIHLDLKPENLFLLSQSSDELKLIDFGFTRRYNPDRKLHAKYGTPEFVAPETASDDVITPAADMWSVGIITYIILSGISPFHCDTPRGTLLKVQEGKFSFEEQAFANISSQAKDFISKLLVKDPKKRMNAAEALSHGFIELSNHRGLGDRIPLDRHRAYIFRRKCQRNSSQVQTVVEPRPLSAMLAAVAPSIQADDIEFDVPVLRLPEPASDTASQGSLELGAAGMLKVMGPPSTSAASEVGSTLASEWGRAYEDEDTWYDFSSAYQSGPDTNLIPAHDPTINLRMASYRRQTTSPYSSTSRPRLGLRERRDLRDLERDAKEAAAASSQTESVGRKHGGRSLWYLRAIADDSGMQDTGFPPIFKEKIRDSAYNVGDSCSLRVLIVANPRAAVNWYRNDELLTDGGRIRTSESQDGYYTLTVLSTKPHDFGVYKCVARNKFGKVTCRARMLLGDVPTRPGRPHVTKVSSQEVFLIWEEPEQDGNSHLQSYRVDWHRPGDDRWTVATYCIDECALIKGLKPDTSYRFRVCALNKFGLGPYSWASVEIRTAKKGANPIDMDPETKRILLRSRQATSRPSPERDVESSSSMEELFVAADKKAEFSIIDREIQLQEIDPHTFVDFGSEVWRGRFTIIRNVESGKKKARHVAKISLYEEIKKDESLREYDVLKSLKQQNLVRMYEAYLHDGFLVLILEKLYGENVVRSLSLKNKYNEQHVSHIIRQVLDGLQYLHHRGIVHLNVQPDNVVMVSRRRLDIKLIDFGRVRKITTLDGVRVEREGSAEYMAPEKVKGELVGVAADVWGVGVLAFILLSGVSPFRGVSDEETFANISHVRYDAHALYHNVTKYSLRFLYNILRRTAVARLTLEHCLEHRWLMLQAPLVTSRKAAVFPTDKLKFFKEQYSKVRHQSAPPARLLSAYGCESVFDNFED